MHCRGVASTLLRASFVEFRLLGWRVVAGQVDRLTNTGSAAGLDRTRINGTRRDIVKDYANFGSSVYAPLARDGRVVDKPLSKLEDAVAGALPL